MSAQKVPSITERAQLQSWVKGCAALVVWTAEFGRMPFTQGAIGRDHNGGTFVTWLAGAGIRRSVSYGQSDERRSSLN
jgi:hypothetical protein